ncbi:MAG: hypothetical protein M1828_002013 [Chrysothrix sp. TS-e1954]|nr:MAG: hypothetical protein M1828_002013 [Chrysothrix sp. TS-e1954]
MTTAHRPTFDPARGKEAQRGPAYHQRLLPAHTLLKQRKAGQGGVGGLAASGEQITAPTRDLRAELLKAEAAVKARKTGGLISDGDERAGEKRKRGTQSPEKLLNAAGEQETGDEDEEAKRRQKILEDAHDEDADSSSSSASESDESEEDDDEDEEAELLRELAKIKAERAAQRAAEEQAKAAKEEEQREYDIARGNPLLTSDGGADGGLQDFGIKRRWDDDVVFKNQARGTEERGKKREFVNDLLRSDFHKKFMTKYVR